VKLEIVPAVTLVTQAEIVKGKVELQTSPLVVSVIAIVIDQDPIAPEDVVDAIAMFEPEIETMPVRAAGRPVIE